MRMLKLEREGENAGYFVDQENGDRFVYLDVTILDVVKQVLGPYSDVPASLPKYIDRYLVKMTKHASGGNYGIYIYGERALLALALLAKDTRTPRVRMDAEKTSHKVFGKDFYRPRFTLLPELRDK